MKIGVISDTHSDRANALPHIMKRFEISGVETIIHCGDIEARHINPKRFNDVPVVCALNEEQLGKPAFQKPPPGWTFTYPGKRVLDIGHVRMYVGHKRAFEFLAGSEEELVKTINQLRRDYDGLRWMCSGHTHHQILLQTKLVNFINPGAVEDSLDGYEFAIIDTENDEIVFSRIPRTKPSSETFSVGIISDSLNISKLDPDFWKKLAVELKARDAGYIIHCGNIAPEDIGREELHDFEVHFYLRPWQINRAAPPNCRAAPPNWKQILPDNWTVEINGYQFYVHLDLALHLFAQSEIDMQKYCIEVKRENPYVSYILFGCTNDAFLEESEQVRIINPGDIANSRTFSVICLPRNEITFGHVPVDPLPLVE
ncbi:MAG: metallophosphoesterase family protein [Candidatus Nealsonbacteria bacterium]|nr:metallophosphoesterase family protein [Candidatus Nealsonbacteria bacterium]